MTKKVYRVRNWQQYNKGLVSRGSLTFWLSEEILGDWKGQTGKGVHGHQKYSNMVILTALTLRQPGGDQEALERRKQLPPAFIG